MSPSSRAGAGRWAALGLLLLAISIVAASAAACADDTGKAADRTYSDGTYLVGTDIPSGLYKGAPTGAAGVWNISTDAAGKDAVAGGLPIGPFYVEVKNGHYLKLQDATVTADVTASGPTPLSTYLGTGVFLVGVDAAPGRYKGVVSGDTGHWEISADANGTQIVTEGSPTTDFYVDVKDGQFLDLEYVTLSQ